MVELLIEAGAQLDLKGTNGMTALHGAAMNGKADVVKILVKKGAPTEEVLSGKYRAETPLFLAVMGGHVDAAKALLNGNANVNAKNADGMTLLHTAAFQGSAPLAKLLLRKGADGGAVTKGKTAFQLAQMKGHKKVLKVIRNFQEQLLKQQRKELYQL